MNYIKPSFDLEEFKVEDVITASAAVPADDVAPEPDFENDFDFN